MASPIDSTKSLGIRRHTSPANHRIPHYLDAFRGKKIPRNDTKWLSFGPLLVAGTAAKVYVLAGRAVIVIAVGATKMVDGLAGEGFGGKSGAGDDDLAVFVLVSRVLVWKLFIFQGYSVFGESGGAIALAGGLANRTAPLD